MLHCRIFSCMRTFDATFTIFFCTCALDATFYGFSLHMRTRLMLGCTCAHAWCYVLGSFFALKRTLDAWVQDLSDTVPCTWCHVLWYTLALARAWYYVPGSSLALAPTRCYTLEAAESKARNEMEDMKHKEGSNEQNERLESGSCTSPFRFNSSIWFVNVCYIFVSLQLFHVIKWKEGSNERNGGVETNHIEVNKPNGRVEMKGRCTLMYTNRMQVKWSNRNKATREIRIETKGRSTEGNERILAKGRT